MLKAAICQLSAFVIFLEKNHKVIFISGYVLNSSLYPPFNLLLFSLKTSTRILLILWLVLIHGTIRAQMVI